MLALRHFRSASGKIDPGNPLEFRVWSFGAIPNDAGRIVDKIAFIGGMQMT
ncbi:hypothetical protein QA640_41765 [Bradyrhizobium sp. CB82]|uniref:hypothetical protein n=1 Tax=Bradyrhizobium sp. CB82 TaxID=3039159 RepID=UPI0024B23AE8|nr:hypothetical protein [Bradyrhizobium sp. CB82]WFU40619.1 hypothetical protein QA640_41765 [Bradyrhizobium sp. CB82]